MPRIQLVKVGHRTPRQKFGQPLGIMYLASYLRKFMPDAEIEIIDMLPEGYDLPGLAKRVQEFKPDILGLSALSFEAAELHQLAALVKKSSPQITIVAGGPYVTTATDAAFKDKNIDFIVRCEGEQTFLELVNFICRGQGSPAQIPGLGWRENGNERLNPARPFLEDLDSIPFPAWDLIKVKNYFSLDRFGTTYINKEYMQVMTSRGCPYHCTYCHRVFGIGFRPRSPENVVEELELLQQKFGIKEIYFVDDCFNCKPSRAKKICDLILERGLKFSINFPNGLRGDILDEELLDKLKAIGTYRITYAVETASERIQKFIKKNLNLEKVKKIIEQTDARNIMVDGFFMAGFPGETRQEIMQTMNFALSSRLHSMNIYFVKPFAGTELYRQAQEMGYELNVSSDRWSYYYPDTTLSEVPPQELPDIARKTFLKFYLNPWRLWRILRLFPNKKQLPYLLWLIIKYILKWT